MNACKAIKRDGRSCSAPANSESGYCFSHDPARAEERRAARVKGGRNRTAHHGGDLGAVAPMIRTVGDVLTLLDYIKDEITNQENSIARSRVLIALSSEYHTVIQTSELEARIIELEKRVYSHGSELSY